MSTSHDWARQMQQTAEYLLSRPEVEIGRTIPSTYISFYGDKKKFIDLVRATVPGRKSMDQWNVAFIPSGAPIHISINRDAVCRKVQEVKYECEPLLSPEEEAQMEESAI
jgi:hypothetical protein